MSSPASKLCARPGRSHHTANECCTALATLLGARARADAELKPLRGEIELEAAARHFEQTLSPVTDSETVLIVIKPCYPLLVIFHHPCT